MNKFKVGDRVIVDSRKRFYARFSGEIVKPAIGLVDGTDFHYAKMEFGKTCMVRDDEMELDVQYYRNERLNKILDR
jgi:hypothetical protein